MSIDNRTDFFLDFQRFGELKLDARNRSEDAAMSVAQQFEGLLVQQMLAAMRAAAKVDQSQHSSYMDFYQDMYDKQLAQTIAGQDRLGIARLIMQQLPNAGGSANDDPTTALQMPAATAAARPAAEVVAAPSRQPAPAAAVPVEPAPTAAAARNEQASTVAGVVLGRVVDDDFAEVTRNQGLEIRWQRPQNFVADLLPAARKAADKLGVSAELLVAQAALETGWGKHTMKFDDGRSSYNLFGIKASGGWQGSALARSSLEYRDGTLASEVSRFRAYASPEHSLADYAEFIQSNSRYQKALSHGGDDEAYIRAVQDAGYATDPRYADKVLGILRGELMQDSLAGLDSGVSDHA